MRSRWSLPAASLAALAALMLIACGGSDGDDAPSGVFDPSTIPTATAPATLPDPLILRDGDAPPAGGETTYTVQDGDSPSSIADQFGITVEELMAANNITDPTSLAVGQVLTVPGVPSDSDVLGETEEPTPAPADTPAPVEPEPTEAPSGQVYIVQDGDIPETIAAQFGITADELMAANGITDPASLQIGQELIIPEPSA